MDCTTRNWQQGAVDILFDVFLFVYRGQGLAALHSLFLVCKLWKSVVDSPTFWNSIVVVLGGTKEMKVSKNAFVNALRYQNAPVDVKPQMTKVMDGKNVIEMLGGCGLFLKIGDQSIIDYPYGTGSADRYFRSAHPKMDEAVLADMKRIGWQLNSGIVFPDIPLDVQFRPLLNLFADGSYKIRIHRAFIGNVKDPGDTETSFPKLGNNRYYPMSYHYYNGEHVHVTDKYGVDSDAERIKYYEDVLLNTNHRPLVLLLTPGVYEPTRLADMEKGHLASVFSFLLDGHHKLQAYNNCKIFPFILRIQTFECGSIDQQILAGFPEDAVEAAGTFVDLGWEEDSWNDSFVMSLEEERAMWRHVAATAAKYE